MLACKSLLNSSFLLVIRLSYFFGQKSVWDKSTIASTNFVEEIEEASTNCLLKDESSARISHVPQAPVQPRPPSSGNERNVMKRNSNTSSSAPAIPTVNANSVLELPAKNAD